MPKNLEGSLFVNIHNASHLTLHDELTRSGHNIGISETENIYKAPFLLSGGQEIIGALAIRRHFEPSSDEHRATT